MSVFISENNSRKEDGLNIQDDGTRKHYKNGKLHREDGPAIEWRWGDKDWYMNGKLHREDGPAVNYIDGTKLYYINGEHIKCSSNEEFIRILKLKLFL